MNQIFKNFAALGVKRLSVIGATVLALMVGLFFGLSYATAPEYRALSGDLTASEAAAMVDSLEQNGFVPRISADGTLISLPERDIARARMALAESGLPAAGNTGWEIFDTSSGIGMNSFLQRINRLRALEGELARSAQTIDSVETARVHLVLPERETFSQERPEATASVILKTRNGMMLDRRQAVAVRNLVASAVPGLSPSNVVVLSATGETILGDDTSDTQAGIVNARVALEDRVARNIEGILSAHVGADNVRVRVAAEISTDRETVVSQSFDPDQQVARSTSSLSEQDQSQDQGEGNVDVANNLPGVDNGNGAAGGSSDSRNKTLDETVFEIGNTRSERTSEAGGIKRLSVAVILNGRTDEAGEYTERTPEEMERIAALVRSAAGVSDDRGDDVTVESMRFVQNEELLAEEAAGGFVGFLSEHDSTLIKGGIFLVALLLTLLLAVRPILSRMRDDPEAEPETQGAANTLVTDAASDPGQAGAAANPSAARPAEEGDEYVSISSVSGNVMKRYIDEVSDMVDQNPEDAIRTIRAWVRQKG